MPLDELMTLGTAVPIRRWGDPVLHRACQRVSDFGPDLWDLLGTLFATNAGAAGAGLAAPQVGSDLAVFVFDCEDAFGRRRQGLVCNPTIILAAEPRDQTDLEGCLSYPGAAVPLARPDFAICHGQDQLGRPITVTGTGTLARCLQHETDHVKGIVMADRLSVEQRRALRREKKRNAHRYPDTWPVTSPDRSA